jgi:hypothetical protein
MKASGFEKMMPDVASLLNKAFMMVTTTEKGEFRVFWDVMPFSQVDVDRRFRGAYCFHHHGDETHPYTAVHPRRLNFVLAAVRT